MTKLKFVKCSLLRACILLSFLLSHTSALADDPTKTVRVAVPEDGAVDYQVKVHPNYVTNLYFPFEVERAWNSNKDAFEVTGQGKVLHIRALTDEAADGNIAVVAGDLKVGVLLAVGDKDEAIFQVFFERPDKDAVVEAAVSKRVLEVERKLRDENSQFQKSLEKDYARRLLANVFRRTDITRPRGIGRNDSHVVARVERVVWVGGFAHVFIELQNRSGVSFILEKIEVVSGKRLLPTSFTLFDGSQPARKVPDGQRRIVVVQFAGGTDKSAVSLSLFGRDYDDPIRVGELALH